MIPLLKKHFKSQNFLLSFIFSIYLILILIFALIYFEIYKSDKNAFIISNNEIIEEKTKTTLQNLNESLIQSELNLKNYQKKQEENQFALSFFNKTLPELKKYDGKNPKEIGQNLISYLGSDKYSIRLFQSLSYVFMFVLSRQKEHTKLVNGFYIFYEKDIPKIIDIKDITEYNDFDFFILNKKSLKAGLFNEDPFSRTDYLGIMTSNMFDNKVISDDSVCVRHLSNIMSELVSVKDSIKYFQDENKKILNTIDSVKYNLTFIDFIYFSVISQTSTGYGDILPNKTSIRIIVSSQILLGLYLLAIAINYKLELIKNKI